MTFKTLTTEEEEIGRAIVNSAYKVHTQLGPGLLEKIYESCLARELTKRGFSVDRQIVIPIHYDGEILEEALRLDLLVENKVIAEIKAVETVNPVWQAQILSQLKMTGLRLGYVINFRVPLIKQGIQRIIL